MFEIAKNQENLALDKPKTTTLHVHHALLYICLPLMNEHNVKLPNVTFCRGREQETKTFFFLFLKFDAVL